MGKPKLSTLWLDGCSGCHMSLLDIDERILDVLGLVDIVYSPLVDVHEFPEYSDITLVEGAIATEDDLRKIGIVRARTKILVSFGDCAVTANVPGMRNAFSREDILKRGFIETVTHNPGVPTVGVPALLNRTRPVHEIVHVDVFMPGCPPSADTIFFALTELLAGRIPDLMGRTRFGI